MKAALDKRIQITAKNEVGTEINYKLEPITVREAMVYEDRPWLSNQLYRSHNISFLYLATFPEGYCVNNEKRMNILLVL